MTAGCRQHERAAEKLWGGAPVLPAYFGLYQNLPFRHQRSVLRQRGQRKAVPDYPRDTRGILMHIWLDGHLLTII